MLFRKHSLLRDFILIVSVLLLILTGLFIYRLSIAESRTLEGELKNVAARINHTFTEGVDYTNNVLGYMGHQIRQNNDVKDYPYILELFRAFAKNSKVNKTLSWTLVSWVDTKDKLWVDAKLGVLSSMEVKTVAGQPHIEEAKEEQWKVKMAKPQLGNTSGKWIIPAALGVADNNGDYIGSLIFGFEIEKLKKLFETYTLDKHIDFVLVDYQHNVVTRSSEEFQPDLSIISDINFVQEEVEPLVNINPLTGENYLIYKMQRYPYAIYLSYEPSVVFDGFFGVLRHNMLEVMLAITSLSFIVWFFYLRIIKPVVQLSDTANALTRDNYNISIPRTSSYELFTLAKALVRMKSYKMRDKRAKLLLEQTNQALQQKNETLNQYSGNLEEINSQLEQTKGKLEYALEVIHDSDREREAFLLDMHRSLYIPISAIMNGVVLLKQEKLGTLNQENYGMIFDAIYDAGKQLESLTTEFLNATQVDVSEILQKCVVFQRRYATEKGVLIKLTNPKKLPIIWADRLRLRQILLSTIYHSLLYIPDNEKKRISITTKLKRNSDKKPEWLEIEVKDNGFGVDEKSRQLFWNNHFKGSNSYNRDPNMMNLDIKTLRHLVALHHGTFTIEVMGKKGTAFTIKLPYLSRDELEIPMELPEAYDKKAHEYQKRINQAIENAKNIVKFPVKKKGEGD